MRARLYAVLVLVMAGCAPGRLVEVDVGLTGREVALDVSVWLPGAERPEHHPVTRVPGQFFLQVPDAVAGTLRVGIDGLGQDGCRVSSGSAGVALVAGADAAVRVPLAPRADGCQVGALHVGDGAGVVTAQAAGVSASCDPVCQQAFPAGQAVTLHAQAAPGAYFAGWSAGCSGTGDCALTVADGPQQVQAAFGSLQVCDGPWCWESPRPLGYAFNGLWGASADDIWAVGDRGTLLHWNGSFWVRWPPVTTQALRGVFGVKGLPAPLIWAVGDLGTILRFDGQAWQAVDSGVIYGLAGVWAGAPDAAWAVGDNGVILRWDGHAWQREVSLTRMALSAVWGSGGEDVWAVGATVAGVSGTATAGVVLHRAGGVWQVAPGSQAAAAHVALGALWGSGPADVWAGGGTGGASLGHPVALHYDGQDWAMVENDDPDLLSYTAIAGIGADDVWLVGNGDGAPGLVHFDGSGYVRHGGPGLGTGSLTALWASAANDTWAAGTGGALLHWDGAAWTRRLGGWSGDLLAIAGTAPEDIYAAGQGAPVLHYDGHAWTADAGTLPDAQLTALWAGPGGDVWAVGLGGSIRFRKGDTPDPFNPWFLLENLLGKNLLAVWASARDDAWAAGQDGVIVHLSMQAPYLQQVASPTADNIYALWGSGAGDVWGVTDGGRILHYDGTTWQVKDASCSTCNWFDVWGSAANDVWAVGADVLPGNGGTLPAAYHFDGSQWQREDPATRTGQPFNALFGVHGDGQGRVWASSLDGILLRQDGAWRAESPISSSIRRLWGPGDGHLWGVGFDATIIHRVQP